MRYLTASLLLSGLLLSTLVLPGCATTRLHATPAVQSYPASPDQLAGVMDQHDCGLRIMTLNVAHGRGESFHQLLQRSTTTQANLDAVAALLKDSGAMIVALQEVDGPSFWSGNFNHIDYLAENGDFSQSVHAAHVDGLGLSYGTALIANVDLREPRAITFDPVVSPVPKGFVVSTIDWPGNPAMQVDIVSVHMDFASQSVRRKQALELVEVLKQRQRPVIVMGDFNDDWQENSTVQHISQALGLDAYNPEQAGLETFPALGERLDWILVSPGITFRSYQVVQAAVSDHHGVFAELELDGASCGVVAMSSPDRTS